LFTEFFAKGLVIGFSIAAPVGPIGVLCIQRTLAYGRLTGFASGLGAATADAMYGFVAAFGLTFISGFLVEQQLWLRIIGGAFLLWMAYRSLTARSADPATDPATDPVVAASTAVVSSKLDVAKAYGSTIALTLANPTTVLSFVAVFAGLGVGENTDANAVAAQTPYDLAALLVLGVFTGSALWWLILSGVAGWFRGRVAARHLLWINRFSGMVLLAFGCFALFSAFR
jgi:threonine/homoserine/homoserine lactone efflux protein